MFKTGDKVEWVNPKTNEKRTGYLTITRGHYNMLGQQYEADIEFSDNSVRSPILVKDCKLIKEKKC